MGEIWDNCIGDGDILWKDDSVFPTLSTEQPHAKAQSTQTKATAKFLDKSKSQLQGHIWAHIAAKEASISSEETLALRTDSTGSHPRIQDRGRRVSGGVSAGRTGNGSMAASGWVESGRNTVYTSFTLFTLHLLLSSLTIISYYHLLLKTYNIISYYHLSQSSLTIISHNHLLLSSLTEDLQYHLLLSSLTIISYYHLLLKTYNIISYYHLRPIISSLTKRPIISSLTIISHNHLLLSSLCLDMSWCLFICPVVCLTVILDCKP
jgi:hypothetical protein